MKPKAALAKRFTLRPWWGLVCWESNGSKYPVRIAKTLNFIMLKRLLLRHGWTDRAYLKLLTKIGQNLLILDTICKEIFPDPHLPNIEPPSVPFGLRPRRRYATRAHHAQPIPYAFREQVKAQLHYKVANKIIEPVTEPSEWCHPIVIVNKPGTKEKKLTVDFQKLTSQVQRPAHPMMSSPDAVSDIKPPRFFSTLDARHWRILANPPQRSGTPSHNVHHPMGTLPVLT